MKQLILTITLGLMIITTYGQKPENYDDDLKAMYKNTIPLITPDELSKEMKTDSAIILLDAREPGEYKVSHLDGAELVGFNEFKMKSVKNIPKDAEIVVYCSLGVRSEIVAEKLKEAGYTNVKNLYGGIFEWVYNDNKIVDKKGNETEKVHAYDAEWSKWLLKGEKVY
jgi:rhodanese-related sulfurtransferase